MNPRKGVDSYRHLNGAEAQADGIGWWMRYLGGSADKDATAAEIADAHSHGVDVGLNYEGGTGDYAGGFQGGVAAATQANNQADALGAPKDGTVWIWYSIDTAATADQVRPDFQGLNSVKRRPVAGYGGTEIRQMKAEGLCRGWWEANAGTWSGHQSSNFTTDTGADIRQVIGGPAPNTDGNWQMSPDCGFWLAPANQGGPEMLDPVDPIVVELRSQANTQAQQIAIILNRLDGPDLTGPDGKPTGMHWALKAVQDDLAKLIGQPQGPHAQGGAAGLSDADKDDIANRVLSVLARHLAPQP